MVDDEYRRMAQDSLEELRETVDTRDVGLEKVKIET